MKKFLSYFKSMKNLSSQEKTIWVNRFNKVSLEEFKDLGIKDPKRVALRVSIKMNNKLRFIDDILIFE